MRALLAAAVAAAAVAAAWPAAGGAANECHGLSTCIPVTGPWVVVPSAAPAEFLLTCPGRAVVGGLDALATTPAVHVEFPAQVGAPVAPGISTTRNALFRALLVRGPRRAAFQPFLGCVPASGGGGRSTVSARVTRPGAPIVRYARNVALQPGGVAVAAISCPAGETRVGAWTALYFRTTQPPSLAQASLVQVTKVVRGSRVNVTAAATDALSADGRAGVQVGVECAP